MVLQAGTRLGPYEVLSPVGAGGMGEVYRALDARLGRHVAVKVLPSAVAHDPAHLARFQREARALAAVSHPNVLAIHDFGKDGDVTWVVTELLDGETLRERIRRERLPWRKAAEIAAAVAEGLGSAHAAGVIHRDLKPENIFLTADGRVKVLDFGLAKVADSSSVENTNSPTLTSPRGETAAGEVVGTVGYMSPEQVRGQDLDGRSDIFALGSVLYEMLTGRRAFGRKTAADVASAILHEEPETLSTQGVASPPGLERILRRCLEKVRTDRFDTARDLALSLQTISSDDRAPLVGAGPVAPRVPSVAKIVAAGAVAVVLAAAFLAAAIAFGPRLTAGRAGGRPAGRIPRQITSAPGWSAEPALSPDGTLVAFTSNTGGTKGVWLVDAQGGEPLRLTGESVSARSPAWFPDGRSLAVVLERPDGPSVWRVPRLGGSPSLLVPDADSPAVSPDGTQIAFTRRGPGGRDRIWTAPLSDPSRAILRTGDDGGLWDHASPAWSPDGTRLCYADFRNLWIVDLSGGRSRPLTRDDAFDAEPAWSGRGDSVVFSSRRGGIEATWRVPVAGGSPVRETGGAGPEGHPSVARDGRLLVYTTAAEDSDVVLFDRSTGESSRIRSARLEVTPALAPDGSAVVFVSDRLGKYDLWLQPLHEGRPTAEQPRRLTDLASPPSTPVFSADGKWIAFFCKLEGERRDVFTMRASGGPPIRVTDHPSRNLHPSFSPDGKHLVFVSSRSGREHLWVVPIREGAPSGPAWQLTDGEETDMFPRWSPTGSLVAFLRAGEACVVEPRPGALVRSVLRGASPSFAGWEPDGRALLLLGAWGAPALSFRRLALAGGAPEPLRPEPALGETATGYFSANSDGRHLAFHVTERRGNLWTLETNPDSP